MEKINSTEMIALIYKLNNKSILIARKDIVKIKIFKRLMIFKVIFEKSKKIFKI